MHYFSPRPPTVTTWTLCDMTNDLSDWSSNFDSLSIVGSDFYSWGRTSEIPNQLKEMEDCMCVHVCVAEQLVHVPSYKQVLHSSVPPGYCKLSLLCSARLSIWTVVREKEILFILVEFFNLLKRTYKITNISLRKIKQILETRNKHGCDFFCSYLPAILNLTCLHQYVSEV